LNHHDETDEQIAWTLAVVLWQALADSLGIACDELGFSVKLTTLPDYSQAVAAIVIYDVCSGGGCFSCSAPAILLRYSLKRVIICFVLVNAMTHANGC
jgi:hypothetical protein